MLWLSLMCLHLAARGVVLLLLMRIVMMKKAVPSQTRSGLVLLACKFSHARASKVLECPYNLQEKTQKTPLPEQIKGLTIEEICKEGLTT